MSFLPVSKKEMKENGWEQPDFVFVTGDAYVDHPSFGTALLSRLLEHYGYKVAILPQPNWKNADDFKRFGKPRLGFLINSGNVDSMVNHFSVFKHRRRQDVYSPGGTNGHRPDRAVIVYANRAREAYPDVPIIIGGLEASLRRLAHYDYWDDKVRRSILVDSRADILMYGMGEKATLEIAEALQAGIDVKDITWIRGTCVRQDKDTVSEMLGKEPASYYEDEENLVLPSFEDVSENSCEGQKTYASSFALQYKNHDELMAKTLYESYGNSFYVKQNPPQPNLTRMEMDDLYALPFERNYHPMYEKDGGVPAIREVKFSITANRGCFGGCAFCALTYHQGRRVTSRSTESVVREAKLLTQLADFKGYIHDVGGPSANFSMPACQSQEKHGVCTHKDCLHPKPCRNMSIDHSDCMEKLRAVREVEGVKKAFVRSGIRYDYLLADKNHKDLLAEICAHHISGTLKVAPEHTQKNVLDEMRKPSVHVFEKFCEAYQNMNRSIGKKQYLIPYLISSHPGSTMDDAVDMALYLKKAGFVPDQVQDFYPTPGTLATCMYYTGLDPLTGKEVYVAKDQKEKQMQRALLHFKKKENREMVMEALRFAHREEAADVLFGETPATGGRHQNKRRNRGRRDRNRRRR